MTPLIIWSIALVTYAIFWIWYIGLGRKLKPEEVNQQLAALESIAKPSKERLATLREFFENDDGKDFVMINLLELKKPRKESSKKLAAYQKVFLGSLFKRAGHPVFIARVAAGKIENIGCDDDNWTAAGMVRYRSRRDLLEIIPETFGSEHHALKLEALERTFAYPATPWSIFGGPKLVVPLVISLLATLSHLLILI